MDVLLQRPPKWFHREKTMKRNVFLCAILGMVALGCDEIAPTRPPKSTSGVQQTTVEVPTDSHGKTAEQRNIAKRLVEDNRPGAVKYLYIISAYSGQVIFSSIVDGKVTSGGKRLTPTTVAAINGEYIGEQHEGIPVEIDGRRRRTPEVLQDDGTYGHSGEYLYWWDTAGRYFQYYITGGVVPLISSEQLAVHQVIINVSAVDGNGNAVAAPAATPPPPPPAH